MLQTQTTHIKNKLTSHKILSWKLNKSSSSSFFGLLALLLITSPLLAIETGDTTLNLVKTGLSSWIPAVKQATMWVFWVLVVIDWTWTFGKLALSGFEIGEFLATLIKKIMFIGVILFLFNVDTWVPLIMDSFSILSSKVNSVLITPDTFINKAIDLFNTIFASVGNSLSEFVKDIFKILAGLGILLAFVMMAIDLFIVYVKFYLMQVVIYFALALGGMEHFRQTALNPILTAVKVGIELFIIQALMGLAYNSVSIAYTELKNDASADKVIQVLVMALIFSFITKLVPTVVEAVMSGSIGDNSAASNGFKQTAAFVGGAAVGAVASTAANGVGITRAMAAARDLHDAQGGDKAFMSTVKGTAKNMANAYKETMAGSFSGGVSNQRGAFTNTMANNMKMEAKMMRDSMGSASSTQQATNIQGSISGKETK